MRKSAYLGILGVILIIAAMLVPTTALACHPTACKCIDSNGVLHVNVCAVGGTVHWTSFQVYKGGVLQDTINFNETITDGNCVEKYWGTGLSGAYAVKVTVDGNCFWVENCTTPCPPVPEVPTIALMSLGLLAMGGFVFLRRRESAEIALS